jgi:hypothetical protein
MGTTWATNSWAANAWGANTWADAEAAAGPGRVYCIDGSDRTVSARTGSDRTVGTATADLDC